MSEERPRLPVDLELDLETLYADLEIDRPEAEQLVDSLLERPGDVALLTLLNDRRYRNKTVLDALLKRARDLRETNLPRARDIADLAGVHVDRALALVASKSLLCDFEILVSAHRSHLDRLAGQPAQALRQLGAAGRRIFHYTGNGFVAAELLIGKALLLVDRGRASRALKLMDQALWLYRKLDAPHEFALSLCHQARILHRAGSPLKAVAKGHQAAVHLDIGREPRSAFLLLRDLAVFYGGAGEFDLAHRYLDDAETILDYQLRRHDQFELARIRGALLVREGKVHEADAQLRSTDRRSG